MSLFRFHIVPILSVFLCMGFVSCTDDEKVLPEQQRQITNFLTGSHVPKLVSEQEAEDLDEKVDFYTSLGASTFRYIADYYNLERQQRTEVAAGDEVELIFSVYRFENRAIAETTLPLFSNDEAKLDLLVRAGLDPSFWSFDPLTVRVGSGTFVRGVEQALAGCREKDVVEVYMAYDTAYGDALVNIVPKESPIVVFLVIEQVRKQ